MCLSKDYMTVLFLKQKLLTFGHICWSY